MSYLGIDIGTSSCKAAAFDASGKLIASAHHAYAVKRPSPDRAELDSSEVMNAACRVIAKTALHASHDPVRAIGISSQGEAFTPVAMNGEYLCDAMVSSDNRAAGLIENFTASFGKEQLYRITGHTPSPLFTLSKLLWLKHEEPEIWRKSARFLCFEDLLIQRLGIEPAIGWPLAGRTMLFDVAKHTWSKEILAAIELEEYKLAQPLPSGSIAGIIPDSIAAELGLSRGVKIVCGGHDQVLGALGAGVIDAGKAMYAAGSVECICPVMKQLTLSNGLYHNNLCCYDYSLPGLYASVAYSLTGSNLLQYFREEFARETSYENLLAELPDHPTSLLALPYFTPSGTPYFDSDTPSAVLGWRLSTSRGELLKALLEGIALEMKLNLELLEESGIKINCLTATGGGIRNHRMLQLKADVLNKPFERIDVDETGCMGAALLAQSADTGTPPGILARRKSHSGKIIRPDPERAELYNRKFVQYRKFYSGIKALTKVTSQK